jgi:hypothetical protein
VIENAARYPFRILNSARILLLLSEASDRIIEIFNKILLIVISILMNTNIMIAELYRNRLIKKKLIDDYHNRDLFFPHLNFQIKNSENLNERTHIFRKRSK